MAICYEIIKPKYMIWSLEQNRWLCLRMEGGETKKTNQEGKERAGRACWRDGGVGEVLVGWHGCGKTQKTPGLCLSPCCDLQWRGAGRCYHVINYNNTYQGIVYSFNYGGFRGCGLHVTLNCQLLGLIGDWRGEA